MTIVDGYGARKQIEVLAETWWSGPEPGQYPGVILLTVGESGDIVIIRHEFTGIEDDGPFFWQERNDFVSDLVIQRDLENGGIYQWTGTYTKFKNGNCRFSGKVEEIQIGHTRK